MATYDVIVLGLGGMGSAAAYHLAARGQRVLGLEQFRPAHQHGSSHGGTRIIREAYYEAPVYVPLVQRAATLWRELERQTDTSLLVTTGGLMIGHPDSELVVGSLASAQQHGLPHDVLSAAELRARYPVFRPDPDEVAVYEPKVGFLRPEACVQAHLDAAAGKGAELHFQEVAGGWQAEADGVTIETDRARYHGSSLVITAGPWTSTLVPDLAKHLQVERVAVFWFRPSANAAVFDRCPIFMWQRDDTGMFYGFPRLEAAVKVARHYGGQITTPAAIDRTVQPEEVTALRAILARAIPDLDGALAATTVCMYTNSPDHHFIIDRHPSHPQVVVAAGFSGHGFKFCSVIGEMLADLALDRQPPLELFRWGRLLEARA